VMAKNTLNAEKYGGRDKGLNPGSENTFHPVLFRKVDCIEAGPDNCFTQKMTGK